MLAEEEAPLAGPFAEPELEDSAGMYRASWFPNSPEPEPDPEPEPELLSVAVGGVSE